MRSLAGMRPDGGLSASGRALLERLAQELLRDRPQLASLYLGDPQGNFLMVQRSPEGTLDTKLIAHEGGRRQVTWYRRDEAGENVATEEDPGETFHPRPPPRDGG